MTIYTITIKNSTTNASRRYSILSEMPAVTGGSNAPVRPIVWKLTDAVQQNGQVQFGYSPDFYGFYGRSTVTSSSLTAGSRVNLQYSEVVKPGYITNNGTQLFVNNSGVLSPIGNKAGNGAFQIIMDSSLATPNRSVVGLARLEEDGIAAPVAAVELKPGAQYTFTPDASVYVTGERAAEGRVVDFPSTDDKFAKVEFRGSQTQAIVTEQADGDFVIQYL